jgi:aminoglycoside phosphotransferase (APT) family kinase protein
MRLLDYERQLMRSELKIHELVRDRSEVPVPAIIAHDFGQQLLDRDYMLLEHYSGQALNNVREHLTVAAQQSIDGKLGDYTRQIHALTGDTFGYPGRPSQQGANWPDAFGKMLEMLLLDAEGLGVDLPVTTANILSGYESVKASFEAITVPVLVHWDLWDSNVFVIKEGGNWRIEGIIDWERTFWGDPEAEVFMLLKPPDDAFFKKYRKPLANDRNAKIRQTFYRIHLWLVMLIEAPVRFHEASHLGYAESSLEQDWEELVKFASRR